MRKLVYIVFALIACILPSAFGTYMPQDSQPGVILQVDTIITGNDSLSVDSAVHAVIDSIADTPSSRHPARNRRVNAVNNAATRTQYVNDAQGDSARMLERRRQRSIHYHDDNGNIIMVDTVTGQEWTDSTLLPVPPKMKQPLMFAIEVGVNIWDPVMRIFGQKYGGIDFSAALNLHNRYIPTFEAGFGLADNTPPDMNFTYKTPLAPYFKLGADYNFIYNSDPDYRFVAGLRYGFSAFRYSLDNVTLGDSYWSQDATIAFPSQNVTAGWLELVLGLRVKIVGPISAGWMFRYHTILHRSHPATGDAWYIPGYGSSSSSITGSFSIVYNLGLKPRHTDADLSPATDVGHDADALLKPSRSEPHHETTR